MNKELASKFVKYIVEMVSALERKSSVAIEDVTLLNRELDNFKLKLRDENGIYSTVYQNLLPIQLELDDRHLEGSVINSILSFRKSMSIIGLFKMFESKKLNQNVALELSEFKKKLQLFACQFDEFTW
jgi:hypothetical protein